MSAARSACPPQPARRGSRRHGPSISTSEPGTHLCEHPRPLDDAVLPILLMFLGQQLHNAAIDGKTGLLTADTWHTRATCALPGDDGHDLALLIIDLDHFKAINDTHGHLAGDAVLAATAAAIRAEVRETDLVGRFGGDEFVVLLRQPPTNDAGARRAALLAVAHRLLRRVHELRIPVDAPTATRGITASIGAATHRPGLDLPALFRAADSALYRAKASGGDTVSNHDPNPPEPSDADPAAFPSTVSNPIAEFIRSQPGSADRLLKLHRDDGTRHCITCSNGASHGRSVFPCAIYAAATPRRTPDRPGHPRRTRSSDE